MAKYAHLENLPAKLKAIGWKNTGRSRIWYSPSGKYRINIQDLSIRLEKRIKYSPSFGGYTPPDSWCNVNSDYSKNVQMDDVGLIIHNLRYTWERMRAV